MRVRLNMFSSDGYEKHKKIQKKCKCGHPNARYTRIIGEGKRTQLISGSCDECRKDGKECKKFEPKE